MIERELPELVLVAFLSPEWEHPSGRRCPLPGPVLQERQSGRLLEFDRPAFSFFLEWARPNVLLLGRWPVPEAEQLRSVHHCFPWRMLANCPFASVQLLVTSWLS